MAPFELRTLGTVELRGADGRSAAALVAQPKRLALLAYLAIAQPRGYHRRDGLLAMFWPESDTGHARTSLRKSVHVIRRALGDAILLGRGDEELAINSDVLQSDVTLFERAVDGGRSEEAIDLYRGELLPSFHVVGAPAFEDWLTRERVRLRSRAAQIARALADRYQEERHLTLAITFARRAVELSESDERTLRRLIEMLDGLGDRAGAVHAYDAFARRLAADMELEPSPETTALVERVRARASSAPPPREQSSRATSRSTDSPGMRSETIAPAGGGAVADAKVTEPTALMPVAGTGLTAAPGYLIERELGRGGMAIVYLARDVKHGRSVALKVLKPEIATAVGTDRFLREIQITAALAHPHILPLLDSGNAGPVPYYVTPYVPGESLRVRLIRERLMTMADAVRVTRQVADALDYAHRRGIVHRDIKPENILFAEQHALVADFGIAHAAEFAGTSTATGSGVVLGSPAYISPEQARGDAAIDARADVYSLGCVLYEMLTGRPPFEGGSAREVIGKHATALASPLRELSPQSPPALERALVRALAKNPSDRFPGAAALADAVEAAMGAAPIVSDVTPRWARWTRGRRTAAAAGIAVFSLAIWFLVDGVASVARTPPVPPSVRGAGVAVDTSRYVVFPFDSDPSVGRAAIQVRQLVADALGWWQGITVVDEALVDEAVAKQRLPRLSTQDARSAAVALRAGRFLRGDITRIGDSMRVRVALHETSSDSVLSDGAVRVAAVMIGADSSLGQLVERFVIRGVGGAAGALGQAGPRSAPAQQAYARGIAAILDWRLQRADSAFVAASTYDLDFTLAQLWLARTRAWIGETPPRWRSAAIRAAMGRRRLVARDQLVSDALVALANGESTRACGLWERLARVELHDFAIWYDLSMCLRRDQAVVHDRATAAGWRFRSSYHRALYAYQRASELLPSIHRALRDRSFAEIPSLFITSRTAVRRGMALPPDTLTFLAYPSWRGDSLVFIPVQAQKVRDGLPPVDALAIEDAVKHQRERFHDMAVSWVASYPSSAAAMEALAISLDMIGDAAALDTLRRARLLATNERERVRVAVQEVWTQLKFALPRDVRGLKAARALADSLLDTRPESVAVEPSLVASLAALTGRASVAAKLNRMSSVDGAWGVPGTIARPGLALLAFAALGGPADSIQEAEKQVASAIEATLPAPQQHDVRLAWLAWPATLAFGFVDSESVLHLAGGGDPVIDAQAAMVRGDTAAVRGYLTQVRSRRASVKPADLTPDGLYAEAALLIMLGDHHGAIKWLDPMLRNVSAAAPYAFSDVVRAGSLMRVAVLRAELAARVGDRETAREWARVVTTLWSDADAFLQPTVRRMGSLLH